MSTEMEEQGQEEETPATGGGRKLMVIALTLGLVVGAGAGSLIVGPLVAEGPAKAEKEGEGEDCSAVLAQHGVVLAPTAVHTIENIVLNPANSGGTRFLMASVGFGLSDLHGAEQMALRDAEIRDIVVRVLGSKTVEQLSDMAMRNHMKEEMRTEVVKVVGEHGLVDIYCPQFVIQ